MENLWVVGIGFLVLYHVPAIVAFSRKNNNRWKVLWLNWLLAWTVIGWVVFLAWAIRDKDILGTKAASPIQPKD